MENIPFDDSEYEPIPMTVDERRQLRVPDKYGVFLWWPEAGTDWIHPDDIELCNATVPSKRVFRKSVGEGPFSTTLMYAQIQIRIKPVLWLEVPTDGFEVGDQIEVRSKLGQRKPFIATIREMFWDRHNRRIDYFMRAVDRELATPYHLGDFQPAFSLSQPMPLRQRELHEKFRFR